MKNMNSKENSRQEIINSQNSFPILAVKSKFNPDIKKDLEILVFESYGNIILINIFEETYSQDSNEENLFKIKGFQKSIKTIRKNYQNQEITNHFISGNEEFDFEQGNIGEINYSKSINEEKIWNYAYYFVFLLAFTLFIYFFYFKANKTAIKRTKTYKEE